MSKPTIESSPVSLEASSARRSFLTQVTAILVGGLAGLIPLASSIVFFLDPIIRRRKSAGGTDGFLKAANVSELPADGTPERFVLKADIHDAWTLYRNRVLGSVYLRLMPTGQVIAFNDTCTHLGCKVDYQASNKRFFCPCHHSAFDLDGIRQNPTPPRDLDELKVEIRDGVVFVKYQNFRTATPEKKALSG
jgi:quinol---cytochrome c reductase iron-sulfur subunit, bacillus type